MSAGKVMHVMSILYPIHSFIHSFPYPSSSTLLCSVLCEKTVVISFGFRRLHLPAGLGRVHRNTKEKKRGGKGGEIKTDFTYLALCYAMLYYIHICFTFGGKSINARVRWMDNEYSANS